MILLSPCAQQASRIILETSTADDWAIIGSQFGAFAGGLPGREIA